MNDQTTTTYAGKARELLKQARKAEPGDGSIIPNLIGAGVYAVLSVSDELRMIRARTRSDMPMMGQAPAKVPKDE